MGAVCGGDKYKQIREGYGLQLIKMVIGQKNKLFLDRMINKLKKEISEYARESQEKAIALFHQQSLIIDQYYAKVSNQLNQRQPGGIKSLEQMTDKTAEQLLGYAFIKDLLRQFRQDISMRYKQEQNNLLNELFQIKIGQQELFNEQKPTVTVYDEMDIEQKSKVMKRGQMQFHEYVVKYQEYIMSRYGHKLKMDYYINRFNIIDPRPSLQGLVYLAKDKFVTSLNLILSQKIASHIHVEQ